MNQIFLKKKNGYMFDTSKSFLNAIFFKELQKQIIYTAFIALIVNMEGSKEELAVKKSINFFVEGLNSDVTF
jgi:hypothetical protein